MKISFCSLFLLASSILFSQKSHKYLGVIKDASNDEPISDVLILHDDELVSFTDFSGEFELGIILKNNDSLVFKHFSFETKKIELNANFSEINITLEPKINQLDNVLIGFDNKAEDIISKARKKFKNSIRSEPYWGSTNLKQVIKLNDTLSSYLEIDGNTFMVGDDKDVWDLPIIVPLEARRTKERFNDVFGRTIQEKNPEFYSSLGINQISDAFLTSYRFFEFAHPLANKGKNDYYYTLERTTFLNGVSCYVIGYKSLKKKSNVKGRYFYSMQGEILLSIESLSIKKITSLHRRSTYKSSKGVDNIFTVEYKEIEETVYPEKISYSIEINSEKMIISLQGVLSFHNIKTQAVENYRRSISSNRYLFHSCKIYNNYNKFYWEEKSTTDNSLELKYFGKKLGSQTFIEGEQQKIKPKDLYPGTTENEEIILRKMENIFKT